MTLQETVCPICDDLVRIPGTATTFWHCGKKHQIDGASSVYAGAVTLSEDTIGGVKFDSGKLRFDLIPPELDAAVAAVLTYGAAKYDARNWEQGMSWSRPTAALKRHQNALELGEWFDPETGMPHLWHMATNIAFLIAFAQRGTGTDDRPTIGGDPKLYQHHLEVAVDRLSEGQE